MKPPLGALVTLFALVALLASIVLFAREERRVRDAALAWASRSGVVGARVVCDGYRCVVTGENFDESIELFCGEVCTDAYERATE